MFSIYKFKWYNKWEYNFKIIKNKIIDKNEQLWWIKKLQIKVISEYNNII